MTTVFIRDICSAYLLHKHPNQKNRHTGIVQSMSAWLGHHPPQAITPNVIAQWRATRPHVQDSSIRRELGALTAALRWGLRHKMFSASDMPTIDLPPSNQSKQIWMDLMQEDAFWHAAQHSGTRKDVSLFVALALDTAARKSAILGLTWDRVDLNKGMIDYRQPGMRKTNKRRIPVPINRRLRPVLESAWTFGAHNHGQRVIQLHSIDKAFRQFATQLGFGWVTPHICRHTWACLAAQAGMPMFHIATMLGDTLKTVEENYAHLAPSHLQQVANWRFTQPGTTP